MRYSPHIKTFDDAVNFLAEGLDTDFPSRFASFSKEEQQKTIQDLFPYVKIEESSQFLLSPAA